MDSTFGPITLPYLDHFPRPGEALQRVHLDHFPFRIGRDRAADLVLYYPRVSKAHAEIHREGETVWILDLGSTNGTFINGRRIEGKTVLYDGDIIHVAETEFRFGIETDIDPRLRSDHTESAMLTGLPSLIQQREHLNEMIKGGLVTALFQPILSLQDRQILGFEALGRGRSELLPTCPGPLFSLAEQVKLAVPLSQAFRGVSLAESGQLPLPHALFLNYHPEELQTKEFLERLQELPPSIPGQRTLVLEVHEGAVTDLATLGRLREQLHERGMHLAYDDFGVGQARLAALAQVPADFVKLDRSIVQGLPHSRALRDLVRALGNVCADLGTLVIAEGMETEEEAAIAAELGCQLAQGYLFARPRTASEIHSAMVSGQWSEASEERPSLLTTNH